MTTASVSIKPRAAISLEVVLYLAVVVLALAMRLPGLDAHPLNDAEAREALTAWRFSLGVDTIGLPASPAYFTLTALGFSIFGDMDFVARLAPALAGAALVLLPLVVRDLLGRGRALLTGALLAVSSIALTASRSADGTILAVFFVLLTAVTAWRSIRAPGSAGWVIVAGAAFGAALASGPSALVGLIALAIALPVTPGAWDAVAGHVVERARVLAVAALAGFLVVGTFFLLNRDGLGAAAASLVDFAQRFNPASAGRSLTALIVIALTYDALILLTGLLSAGTAFLRGGVDRFAATAAMVALTVIVAASGRTQFDLIWLVVFLAPLAAHLLSRVAVEFRQIEHPWVMAAAGGLAIALTASVVITLSQFSEAARGNPDMLQAINWLQRPWYELGQAIAAAVLVPVGVVLLGLGWSYRSAVQGLISAIGVLLLAGTLAAGWSATRGHVGLQTELWWPQPVTDDVTRLRDTLLWSGEQSVGEGTEIDVVVQGSTDGALAWALRDFRKASFVGALGPEVAASAVIAPAASEDPAQPELGAAYVGAPFHIDPVWPVDPLTWAEQLDWLLLRRAPIEYPTITILWLRQDVQAAPLVQR